MTRADQRTKTAQARARTAVLVVAAVVGSLLLAAPAQPGTAPVFADVPADHAFAEEISWLVAEGITTGFPGNEFRPGAAVSRQAMAAFLFRFAGASAPACTGAAFVDVGADHVFCREISWLVAEGITTGFPGNEFRPGAAVSRQAMAAFLFRFADEDPGPEPAEGCPDGVPRWSDPATWPGPGGVPEAGDEPTIPEGEVVALDVDTPALDGLTVEGTLIVCRLDLELRSDWIVVHGAMRAGTEAQPFTQRFTITLTDTNQAASVMGMGTRGLLVMGGELALHGAMPDVAWTQLADHAPAGSSSLQLQEAVDWLPGDRLAVTTTDWYGASATEQRTIATVGGGGTVVTLTSPLAEDHWGVLQHVTSSGMGLAPDPSVVPSEQPTPLVLDERAEVANLSRPITIQAPDDQAWQQDGFGAQVMIMDLASDVAIEGVELQRVGQRGNLGRYPIHWHRLSYAVGGDELGDATGHHVSGSTITGSSNRCITVHATNGVRIEDNVCIGVQGHGIFLEDAVERRTVIVGNLVAQVRNPAPADALKVHEVLHDGGSSAFWISNPDNVVQGNVAADAQGFGFWLPFPQAPVGLSSDVDLRPDRLRFGTFEDNTSHSNGRHGLMLDEAEVDDLGNTYPHQYYSTTDGQEPSWPFATLRRFTLHQVTTYKNAFGGFWNRVTWPTYTEWVSADNEARYFAGAGADGIIERSLVVGTSLNSATPRPHPDQVPTAFASYHSAFSMRNNVVVGFPMVPGTRSGVFATDDYYIRPVDEGHARNDGNLLITSDPGYHSSPPNASHVFSGALWDPHGTWGPAGRYLAYDTPFLTHDTTCSPVLPAGTNAVSCAGSYYGALEFVLDQGNDRWDARMPIDVTRYDAGGAEVGSWVVQDGNLISSFQNMRHFAAHQGGRYLLDFPASAVPGDVGLTLENLPDTTDSFVLGLRFDGDDAAQVFTTSTYNYFNPGFAESPPSASKHDFTSVGSLAEVMASSDEVFWQDAANDVVWVRVEGGLALPWAPGDFGPFDDETLYEAFFLRVL
jgi:hypothetical protein